ncbi:MAG TPA: HRDC domain-containing protein, partial [bacterium]|nr:HRDC domain-containing protein [bacterium]
RQLAAADYLESDLEGYGTFKLAPKAWAVLKEGEKVFLREDPPAAKGERGRRKAKSPIGAIRGDEGDPSLFQSLRALRSRLAKEQDLPPYVVFHDSTLREMAARRPATLAQFAQIPGVGEAKLKRYGPAFLEVLQAGKPPVPEAKAPKDARASAEETLDLFRQGLDVPAIAARRGLTPGTVWEHLSGLIQEERLPAGEVVGLPDREMEKLRQALVEAQGKLKPVFEAFGGKYSYDILKCVRSGIRG